MALYPAGCSAEVPPRRPPSRCWHQGVELDRRCHCSPTACGGSSPTAPSLVTLAQRKVQQQRSSLIYPADHPNVLAEVISLPHFFALPLGWLLIARSGRVLRGAMVSSNYADLSRPPGKEIHLSLELGERERRRERYAKTTRRANPKKRVLRNNVGYLDLFLTLHPFSLIALEA